ncbi:MAG: helix-turn-helix domain-containing protein [Candidatus Beckwithbacteria bacterium]
MNKMDIKQKLNLLGLSDKQAEIYLLLLKQGLTSLLELSRLSLINRTTIYRIIEDLKKINLVEEVLDDRGAKVKAVKPENLQLLLAQKETELSVLKNNLPDLISDLSAIKDQPSPSTQVVYFRGQNGLKQLLWNVLKAKKEHIGFGYSDWNEGVGREFAEKLRQEFVNRRISSREIENEDALTPMPEWTKVKDYQNFYECKFLPKSIVEIKHDTYIYNDVFAFYHFYQGELFGIEIHNAEIANTQKQIFEVLWKMGKKTN